MAAWSALRNHPVLIVNNSADLTFRDFKKASEASAGLGIEVVIKTWASNVSLKSKQVCFVESQELIEPGFFEQANDLGSLVLIIDEFDSFIFESLEAIDKKIGLIRRASHVIAFSGSSF